MSKIFKVEVTAVEHHEEGAPFDQVKQVRLISAKSKAAAIAHVVKDAISCEVLSVKDARTFAELPIEESEE